jgi:hypothetical protein
MIPSILKGPFLFPSIRHRNTDAFLNQTATNTEPVNQEIATEIFEIAKSNLRCLVTPVEKHNKIKSILARLGKHARNKAIEIEKFGNELQFIKAVYPELS